MKIKLPVTWQVSSFVEVDAKSIQDAIENFDGTLYDLPEADVEYIDGSFQLNLDNPSTFAAMQ